MRADSVQVVGSKGKWGEAPLSGAAKDGNQASLKLWDDAHGRAPLSSGAESGHAAVMKLVVVDFTNDEMVAY